jgi:hypothetical protein
MFTHHGTVRRAGGNPRYCEECFPEYEAQQREEAARRAAEWEQVRDLDIPLEELVVTDADADLVAAIGEAAGPESMPQREARGEAPSGSSSHTLAAATGSARMKPVVVAHRAQHLQPHTRWLHDLINVLDLADGTGRLCTARTAERQARYPCCVTMRAPDSYSRIRPPNRREKWCFR